MTTRAVCTLLFTFLSLSATSGALIEAKAENGKESLILSDRQIGPLKLGNDTKLDLEELRTAFTGLSVKQKIGQQDGPDFTYYEVSDNEGKLFWIKAQYDDPKKIDSIHVTSAKILDQYGLRVGSTYREILHVRPRLKVETDYHFHTYIGHSRENIVYELAVSYRENYQGPDRKPTKQELERGKVKALLWFPRYQSQQTRRSE